MILNKAIGGLQPNAKAPKSEAMVKKINSLRSLFSHSYSDFIKKTKLQIAIHRPAEIAVQYRTGAEVIYHTLIIEKNTDIRQTICCSTH